MGGLRVLWGDLGFYGGTSKPLRNYDVGCGQKCLVVCNFLGYFTVKHILNLKLELEGAVLSKKSKDSP